MGAEVAEGSPVPWSLSPIVQVPLRPLRLRLFKEISPASA